MSRIDPTLLLAAIDKLESRRAPQGPGGPRRFRRFVVRGDALLQPMDATEIERRPTAIALRDVGGGGIGFVCGAPVETGSAWRVGFLDHGYVVAQQAMVVRHSQVVEGQVHLIGGQFCAESGLLCLLGADPTGLLDGDGSDDGEPGQFLAPGQVQ